MSLGPWPIDVVVTVAYVLATALGVLGIVWWAVRQALRETDCPG